MGIVGSYVMKTLPLGGTHINRTNEERRTGTDAVLSSRFGNAFVSQAR
jgi:hypothetical protein